MTRVKMHGIVHAPQIEWYSQKSRVEIGDRYADSRFARRSQPFDWHERFDLMIDKGQ